MRDPAVNVGIAALQNVFVKVQLFRRETMQVSVGKPAEQQIHLARAAVPAAKAQALKAFVGTHGKLHRRIGRKPLY